MVLRMTNKKQEEFPQGFTMGLAVVDIIPVLFFCGSAVVIGLRIHSLIFWIGAVCCIFAGMGKVMWKILLAGAKKDIRILNTQMRFAMPAGFVCMIIGLCMHPLPISAQSFLAMPSAFFFLIGLAGIICMTILGIRNKTTDVKANWIEQIVNCIAQGAIFFAIFYLK